MEADTEPDQLECTACGVDAFAITEIMIRDATTLWFEVPAGSFEMAPRYFGATDVENVHVALLFESQSSKTFVAVAVTGVYTLLSVTDEVWLLYAFKVMACAVPEASLKCRTIVISPVQLPPLASSPQSASIECLTSMSTDKNSVQVTA
jgi:hypothetical protein